MIRERAIWQEEVERAWTRREARMIDAKRRQMRVEREWARWREGLFWASAIVLSVALGTLVAVMTYGV